MYEDLRKMKVNLQIYKNKFLAAVVSPTSGDGKSSIVWGIANVFADHGYKVAIVDLNFRHPEISEKLGLPQEKCISNLLSGVKTIEDIEMKIKENISLFGTHRENIIWDSDIFASKAFLSFIVSLKDRFDFVFADTSPLFVVPDSIMMLKYFDIVLAVYDLQSTSKRTFKKFIGVLKECGSKSIRCVVNKIPREYGLYYYYYKNNQKQKKYYRRYSEKKYYIREKSSGEAAEKAEPS